MIRGGPGFRPGRRSGKLAGMGEVLPMPAVGDVFADVRGDDRTMRVSYHQDRGVVVVSLWAGVVCRGSFRLAAGEVGRLAAVLSEVAALSEVAGRSEDAAPEDGRAAEAAAEPATPSPAPSPEQTGDVSRGALVPRVA
jgi:hypothetical protein